MNNDIKEILKYIDQFVYVDQTYNDMKLSKVDGKLILDYITNLQEELEEEKRIEQASLDTINNLQEENERLKELDENYPIEEQLEEALKYENIYKSIIDKAIEYIKENIVDIEFMKKEYNERTLKNVDIETTFIDIENLLNILKGNNNERLKSKIEEKKIPEKFYYAGDDVEKTIIANKINEIIDYLKSKGEENEKTNEN